MTPVHDADGPPPERSPCACVVDCRAVLGEGPVWVVAEQALYWVDIKGFRIMRRDAAGEVTQWPTPMRVGSVAPHADGGLIAGTEHGFARVDPASGRFDILADPEAERRTNRFNDGKVDRAGRFWAGTMDDTERAATGALYRLEADAAPVRVDDGYRVTNGPAFSRDGRVMYHTDSALQTVYAFDLDEHGTPANKRVFAQFGNEHGYPDGMTVDADDHLWIAFWDGWCVRRLSPDGDVVATIAVPVQRPTSVAFGGAGLDQLFVTSARVGLADEAMSAQPLAGGLFMLRPGVAGLPELPFTGGRHR